MIDFPDKMCVQCDANAKLFSLGGGTIGSYKQL